LNPRNVLSSKSAAIRLNRGVKAGLLERGRDARYYPTGQLPSDSRPHTELLIEALRELGGSATIEQLTDALGWRSTLTASVLGALANGRRVERIERGRYTLIT
jgi:hypothetical protein